MIFSCFDDTLLEMMIEPLKKMSVRILLPLLLPEECEKSKSHVNFHSKAHTVSVIVNYW